MLASFFESIKFIGHLLPVSFLRIFLGYMYLEQGFNHIHLGWLDKPVLSSKLSEILLDESVTEWYRFLFEVIGIPHWLEVSFLIILLEIGIGISYLLGYLVRPMALIAASMVWFHMGISNPSQLMDLKIVLVVSIFLAWIGAGRVLGLDYYFYKKHRGIWW
jgi:thiosulfate dehydrogenase (quinone) large subunit